MIKASEKPFEAKASAWFVMIARVEKRTPLKRV
jgi:hypothetical protein